MIDNIKNLYSQVYDKTAVINEVANELGLSPGSVRNNYLGRDFRIPEENQERVVTILQNTLKHQIESLKEALGIEVVEHETIQK
ncbi:hypothetical protein [Aquimarina sp. AU119]|uniref:hypothetical protein n=1 Tax=Aquimarina sp. AU119 TaxID=2108528 RepID=UPI000D687068|nr:hypothetical protein [Aquimarina sp. AU119]